MSLLSNIKKVFASKENRQFDRLTEDAIQELQQRKESYWSFKPNEYRSFQELSGLPDKEKVGFILYGIEEIHSNRKGVTVYSSENIALLKAVILETVIQHLL